MDNPNRYILGVNLAAHDTSACLLNNGGLISFVEEERLTRVKHTGGQVPYKSINSVLKDGGISIDQVPCIAISTDVMEHLSDSLKYWVSFEMKNLARVLVPVLRAKIKFNRMLKEFKKTYSYKGEITIVDHHLTHLANAFLVSPFKKSAILSIDGGGDGLVMRTGYGNENQITILDKTTRPHSVGLLYERTTSYLGFPGFGNEGKVMGLSSYGDPAIYRDIFKDIVLLNKDGSHKLNLKYFRIKKTGPLSGTFSFSNLFYRKLGPERKPKEPLTKRHEDISASLQEITEKAIFHALNDLYQKTKCDNISLSGGVILNSVANGKIHRRTPFKNIFVQPLAYDAGNAIGAAFYVWNCVLEQKRNYVWKTCYLGPSFSSFEIEKYLQEIRLSYEKLDNPPQKAAELIADGKIIGWFQGKMEAGARSLGNRSILADPRKAEMKDIINSRVKHRESFRPFAPSILKEQTGEYFEDDLPVPYMEKVFMIKPEKRSQIPAVTHVDGTGRLQTVAYEDNPQYYNLIKEFEKITEIPIVLNTSFNVQGEPIVCTPEDAIKCFFSTGMDCLIIDKFLIRK